MYMDLKFFERNSRGYYRMRDGLRARGNRSSGGAIPDLFVPIIQGLR